MSLFWLLKHGSNRSLKQLQNSAIHLGLDFKALEVRLKLSAICQFTVLCPSEKPESLWGKEAIVLLVADSGCSGNRMPSGVGHGGVRMLRCIADIAGIAGCVINSGIGTLYIAHVTVTGNVKMGQ